VEAPPYNWFRWVHQTMLPRPTYDEVLAATRQFSPQLGEADLREMAARVHGVDAEAVGVFLRDEAVEGYDFARLLEAVKAPTLILRADPNHEPAMDDADAAFAETHLRHGQMIMVPNAGHRVHVDQTEAVLHHI